MDSFDPAIQSTASSGWEPFVTLVIFAAIGSFFLGALFTAITKGMKEEGWFNLNNNKNDD
ncbi:hypothetical protein [Prochlorococcus sp. MIT 1223]|uniref:hypothetical protein n=1 Tax=Prochlorococcus sp. MIT 1223 TaxID=3096217 RepID=UPI002A74DE9E|nr:hypothetical protein [Prochlorococcus sp. MIT 1223]